MTWLIVCQDGPLHLPSAESLHFKYLFTVTFVQFIGTFLLLQLVGYTAILVTRKRGLEYVPPPRDDYSKAVNRQILVLFSPIDSITDAIFIFSEAVLGTQVLFHSPVEVYILSRGLVIPIFWALMKIRHEEGSITWSSAALSASTILASYRPGILQSLGIRAAVVSPLFTALTFSALQRSGQMLDMKDTVDGIHRDTEDYVEKEGAISPFTKSHLQMLNYTSIFTALLILPTVLWSGELSQLYRNYYLLHDPLFEVSTLLSTIFRCLLFTSTILLIHATSAQTALFWSVFMNVAIVPLFRSSELIPSQHIGLACCFLATGTFLWYNDGGLRKIQATNPS